MRVGGDGGGGWSSQVLEGRDPGEVGVGEGQPHPLTWSWPLSILALPNPALEQLPFVI